MGKVIELKKLVEKEASAFDILDKIITAVNKVLDKGVEYSDFYPYSGRAMYGSQTVGVTIDRDAVAAIKKKLTSAKISYSVDNMGMDAVFYFPQIKYEDVKSAVGDGDENESRSHGKVESNIDDEDLEVTMDDIESVMSNLNLGKYASAVASKLRGKGPHSIYTVKAAVRKVVDSGSDKDMIFSDLIDLAKNK